MKFSSENARDSNHKNPLIFLQDHLTNQKIANNCEKDGVNFA